MKLAVAVEKDNGFKSRVYGHFGSAPYYAIYDDETDNLEIIKSDNDHRIHGNCQPTTLLSNKGVNAIVCGGMGYRAISRLSEMGIKVYFSLDSANLNEVIQKFKQNQLKELSIENACMGHGHHY